MVNKFQIISPKKLFPLQPRQILYIDLQAPTFPTKNLILSQTQIFKRATPSVDGLPPHLIFLKELQKASGVSYIYFESFVSLLM